MRDMQDKTGTPLTPPAPVASGTRPRAGLVLVIALATLVIDQGSKIWALRSLIPGEGHPLLGDLLSLRLVRNPGAAFSSLGGMTVLVTLIAVVIVLALGYYVATRPLTRTVAIGLGLIAGGAAGNLGDRFFREPGFLRGHVVDFIDYAGWFVGNIADIAIVGAAIGLLLLSWRTGADGSGSADE